MAASNSGWTNFRGNAPDAVISGHFDSVTELGKRPANELSASQMPNNQLVSFLRTQIGS